MIERFMQNIKRAVVAALMEGAKSLKNLKLVIKNRGKLDPTYKKGWHTVVKKEGADV